MVLKHKVTFPRPTKYMTCILGQTLETKVRCFKQKNRNLPAAVSVFSTAPNAENSKDRRLTPMKATSTNVEVYLKHFPKLCAETLFAFLWA